ncbi:MAG: hypothetical protein ACTSQF_13245 [Candidatus Heimdallarchaeaceae archaeon]
MKISFSKILTTVLTPFLWIAGVLLYLVVVFAKCLFFIYELIIPRGLRDLVPVLNLWRRYLVYASNLFSSHEKIELVKLEEEIEEIQMKEDRINKAYPIQRGVGETYDHLLIIVVIIAVSVVLVGTQTTDFATLLNTVLEYFFPGFSELPTGTQWLLITLAAFIFSTIMGMLSFIATVFGPIYALFHRASLRMIRMGAYSWGSFYQRLENLFSLPYLASKASFSFFEAPPVDASTFEEFKVDLVGDLKNLQNRFTNIISVSTFSLPEKSKKLYEQFFSSETEDRLDMTKVEDSLSRVFSLLLWQKETYIIPWKKEPGLAKFAKENSMSYREAKQTLVFVTNKLKEEFISEDFFKSILLNGALKGIIKVEDRYDMPISDLEYNQLAFSIALGANRYILDHFAKEKFFKRIAIKLRNVSFGFVVPFLELGLIFYSYGKHIGGRFKLMFSENWTKRTGSYLGTKFIEIQKGLNSFLLADEPDEELDETAKAEAKESLNMILKVFLFLFKVILALPLSLYYFAKLFYMLISNIWKKRKPEDRVSRKFSKDIAKETIVAMYDEVYEKLVMETFHYT